ncbi:MAG: glycosyl hydrolase family protein [Candidatus Omnitrophota bacterium]|nr:MAG: glycosyl hydrolase family protein [Candidatus Omnitrophota bacterium]
MFGDVRKNGTAIDIFEYLVRYKDIIHINLHWDGYRKKHKTSGFKYNNPKIAEGFHTIDLDWKPDEYVIYVDERVIWRTNQAVSHRTQYIILSLEVGEWAGNIKEAELPDSAYFDYVRVYQIPSSTD